MSYISSYNIDIKPPVYLIGILYTSFSLLSIYFLYNNVAPTKITKIMVDKSLICVYNINRCTLKGHTYTSHTLMPQGSSLICIIDSLLSSIDEASASLIRNFLGISVNNNNQG